jgi:hypothetical protein
MGFTKYPVDEIPYQFRSLAEAYTSSPFRLIGFSYSHQFGDANLLLISPRGKLRGISLRDVGGGKSPGEKVVYCHRDFLEDHSLLAEFEEEVKNLTP